MWKGGPFSSLPQPSGKVAGDKEGQVRGVGQLLRSGRILPYFASDFYDTSIYFAKFVVKKICRSMGYDVRHVCDWADHVWVEVWSEAEKRWVHADPCENVYDKPLMYEVGKNVNMIIDQWSRSMYSTELNVFH